MKAYIDKAALIAEIEKELNTTKKYSTEYVNGKKYALKKILSFINTFEVKEVEEEPVSEDLGEAANTYVDNWYKLNNLDKESYPIDVEISKNDFKAGAKWQKTKAYEWLKEHKEHPLIGCEDPCLSGYLTDEFIEDFKKAMEE